MPIYDQHYMRVGGKAAVRLKLTTFFYPTVSPFDRKMKGPWFPKQFPPLKLVTEAQKSSQFLSVFFFLPEATMLILPYWLDMNKLSSKFPVKCSDTLSKTTPVPNAVFRRFYSDHLSSSVEYHIQCCGNVISELWVVVGYNATTLLSNFTSSIFFLCTK